MDHSPDYPNPFSWKEGNCEVVVMNKKYIYLYSLALIFKNLPEDSF